MRDIDLGVITPLEQTRAGRPRHIEPPRYFCCVAGVGLDGEVARRANRLPRWLRGHGGYALSLAPTIFHFAPLPMKILTPADDGETPDLDHSQRSAHAPGRFRQYSDCMAAE